MKHPCGRFRIPGAARFLVALRHHAPQEKHGYKTDGCLARALSKPERCSSKEKQPQMNADTETMSSYRHASPFGAFFMGHQNLSMTIFISVHLLFHLNCSGQAFVAAMGGSKEGMRCATAGGDCDSWIEAHAVWNPD